MICLSCHQKMVVSRCLSSSTMEEESFNGTAIAGHTAGGLGLSKTSLPGRVLNARHVLRCGIRPAWSLIAEAAPGGFVRGHCLQEQVPRVWCLMW